MNLLFSTLILFGSFAALACPKLAGNYKCMAGGEVGIFVIAESQINGSTLYTFSPKLMGLYSHMAVTGNTEVGDFFQDKKLSNGKPLFTNDKYRAVCSENSIMSQWSLNAMNWSGNLVAQEWSGLTNIVASTNGVTVLDSYQHVYKFENDRTEKKQFFMNCEKF